MEQRDRNSAQTVEKALRILRIVGSSDLPMGLRELTEATGFSPTSVQRLVKALEKEGALTRDRARVTIGWMIRGLTGGHEWHDELKSVAGPTMLELRGLCGQETVGLYVPINANEFICIETVANRNGGLTYIEAVYQPIRLAGGATSRVFLSQRLATFGRPALETYLSGSMNLEVCDQRMDREVSDITAIEAAGVSVSESKRFEGLTAISVPIRNQRNQVIAALTVAGLSQRFTPEAIGQWTTHCTTAAHKIRGNYISLKRSLTTH